MATRTARIKSHTRVSKNGKVHKVRAHGRTVTLADWLKSGFQNAKVKKVTLRTAATMGTIGVVYVLSTAMSVAAALIWAILLACMAVITMLLLTKQQRRQKWRSFRGSAALSMERRLKLWRHQKVAQFKRPTGKAKV